MRQDSLRRAGRLVLAVALALGGSLGRPAEADSPPLRGRKLVDVLRELQADGLKLIYSSAVVGDELRVETEPATSDPRALLDEILPPLGLRAADGPGGSIQILPADPRSGEIAGRVVTLPGGRPIAGASVRVPDAHRVTNSSADGSFALPGLPPGPHPVVVEAAGFTSTTIPAVAVASAEVAELTVRLPPQPVFVTEVVVTPGQHSLIREEQTSNHVVTDEEVALAPTIGGDVARLVELLPGVTAADNSSTFHVRGSETDGVSLVLDGLELYDPFHLQSFDGPFSLVDVNVVDRVDFVGGGFTAERGDRHGGFVEMSTLAPDNTGQGEVELGTLNSRAAYRAPLGDGAASCLVSARAWYPEAFVDATQLGQGEDLDPHFADLYGKLAFNVPPRHSLSLHYLAAYDRLEFSETGEKINETVDDLTRSGYAWIRLLSARPRSSSETVVSGGRIESTRDGISAQAQAILVDDERTVDFFGLSHGTTWRISEVHALKAGAVVRRLHAEYEYSNVNTGDPQASSQIRLRPAGTSLAAYAAYRFRPLERLAAEIGARWDRQTYTDDNRLSPRFNAVWRPAERSELRLAWGRFTQSQRIHELDVEDGETEFHDAETAEQRELSFRQGLAAGLQLRVDLYDHRLSDLRPRYENLWEPIELFPETSPDRVRVAPAEARLRGIELLLRGGLTRPLYWWVGYTLSSADDVIDGRDVPRSWDQTHAGKFLVGYRRENRWSLSLSGTLHTGWPTTPVLPGVKTASNGSTVIEPVPGERNSERFTTYARLDFKGRRGFALPRGRLWLTLEVLNLTDHDNPCCLNDVFFDPRSDGTIEVTTDYGDWLGTTPLASVSWEF